MARDSDSLYHRLFAHPLMVEALLREFVPESLAAGLDFAGLQRLNPKFHLRRRWARHREADVIWRLPTLSGNDIYLYLLIEFQSKSDWWMAVRTQVYQGLLWQQVIDEKQLQAGARLPPLLLVVLYNGARNWTAPIETRELITLPASSPLWPWQPQVRYYLLNMGAFPEENLARRAGLAALLFRLEQLHSPEGLAGLLTEVMSWFREHEEHEKLQELFIELVREAFADLGAEMPQTEGTLQMMKTNLSTLGKYWKQQWKAELLSEGHAEGRAEGHAEGKAEGKAEALVDLLTERFGTVSPSLCKKIHRARLGTVERWFKRAVAAPDVSSVFGRSR